MNIQELVPLLLEQGDKYMVESVEPVITGYQQTRKHRSKRINKKWAKRYGVTALFEFKKCKKLDVTPQLIIQFCAENNIPLPDEMLGGVAVG